MDGDASTTPLPPSVLKPYASVIVLICPDGTDPSSAFSQLTKKLQNIRKTNSSRSSVVVVREGLEPTQSDTAARTLNLFDEVSATVHRVEVRPSWLKEPLLTDTRHELTVAFRRGRLIAVHISQSIRDSFQTWLDKPPRPMVRRVSSEIFEQALLRGESRGLWLRGTLSPRKTMADSKNIVGPDVRQTLSAAVDQTYALNSARSTLPVMPTRIALTGTVGTTPVRSLVWNKATDNFDEFVQCCLELLALIAETMELDPTSFTPAFELLTQPVFDFANVSGAYDISCANPVDLPDGTDEAKIQAAYTLEDAFMVIHGREDGADFELDIGQNMT